MCAARISGNECLKEENINIHSPARRNFRRVSIACGDWQEIFQYFRREMLRVSAFNSPEVTAVTKY